MPIKDHTEMASLASKLIPLPGLIVSSTIAIMLLIYSNHNSPALYAYISGHPTSTQIGLQLVIHVLGFTHVLALSTIMNLSTRLHFQQNSVSLARLQLWSSLSAIKVAWNLPMMHAGVLFGYLFLHLLPASLWAGALAPIPTQSTILGQIHIAAYPEDPSGDFWNQTKGAQLTFLIEPVTRNGNGVFSFTPAAILHGPILNSASGAAGMGSPQVHAKIDNSQLSYTGRSYGVGASAGLDTFVLPKGDFAPLNYVYEETGYLTQVNCLKNETTGWGLHFWANRSSTVFPDEYLACGVLPNSPYYAGRLFPDSGCAGHMYGFEADWYGLLSTENPPAAHLFALQGRSGFSHHFFAIATGDGVYSTLNKTQCEAVFIPQRFQISVNMTTSLITVEPIGNSSVEVDPSSGTYGMGLGLLPQWIIIQATYLSRGITGPFTSALADAFISNTENVALAQDASANDTSIILKGTSTALESIIDDLLVQIASAQLEIAWRDSGVLDAATSTSTLVTVAAMRLGTLQYIILAASLNFLIVLVYVEELIRTRAWHGLQAFDYTDIVNVIVAVSRGGENIALAVTAEQKERNISSRKLEGLEGSETKLLLQFKDGRPILEAEDPLGPYNELTALGFYSAE
ncbi:hypothetical protein R3P38DRAFT_3184115 [Favolaschia claudopus]|uniref:Uncharacterized protein n=1 Tax=Favolaschia claudopus TaxID=2862362 RepID=A0AAW0CBM4_9AGAR